MDFGKGPRLRRKIRSLNVLYAISHCNRTFPLPLASVPYLSNINRTHVTLGVEHYLDKQLISWIIFKKIFIRRRIILDK